jgi:hypothetical protein
MYGVSRATISRCVTELGLTNVDRFSTITDDQLDDLLSKCLPIMFQTINYTLLCIFYVFPSILQLLVYVLIHYQ